MIGPLGLSAPVTFGGRLDVEHATGPVSRWMGAEGPLAGDFRDWDRIRAWAIRHCPPARSRDRRNPAMMPRERFSDEDSTNEFRPISPRRCQELLESQSIGRIAWQAADGPQILPVTYACHEGTIIFRTSPYGVLSELVRPTDVALEIDELDQAEPPGMERGGTGPRAGSRRAGPAGTDVDGGRRRSVGLWRQERLHPDHSPPDNRTDSGSTVYLRAAPRSRRLSCDHGLCQIIASQLVASQFAWCGRDFSPNSLGPDPSSATAPDQAHNQT